MNNSNDLIWRAAVLNNISDLMKSPWYTAGKDGERHFQYLVRKDAVEVVKVLCVEKEPSVDVAPVVHGRWIASEIPNEKYVCSICGGACWYYDYQAVVAKSRYCPNCGAKMDG